MVTKFEKEIEDLIGKRPDGWVFFPNSDGGDAVVFFAHAPSPSQPNGQPLSWEDLEKLNDEYGVVEVKSHSHGMTGSRLSVGLQDP